MNDAGPQAVPSPRTRETLVGNGLGSHNMITDDARPLVERAIAAHGGSALWAPGRELVVRFTAGGPAFAVKGHRRTLNDLTGRVATTGQRVTMTPFPKPGHHGVFDAGDVRIRESGGAVVAARRHSRTGPRRLRRRLRWDALDLLYFTGAALWTYLALPFALARDDVTVGALGPCTEQGERWQRLGVRFHAGLHTHGTAQILYLDDAGRIRRHDYTAEAFGDWARAAQYCEDHRRFGDLLAPTRRLVHPCRPGGAPLSAITLVRIALHDAVLRPASPR